MDRFPEASIVPSDARLGISRRNDGRHRAYYTPPATKTRTELAHRIALSIRTRRTLDAPQLQHRARLLSGTTEIDREGERPVVCLFGIE